MICLGHVVYMPNHFVQHSMNNARSVMRQPSASSRKGANTSYLAICAAKPNNQQQGGGSSLQVTNSVAA